MKKGCPPPDMRLGVMRTGARIMAVLNRRRDPLSAREIRDELELNTNATHMALRKLRKNGGVTRTGIASYLPAGR